MLLSVVVPVYNRVVQVGRCVESVLAQDFHDFELVMVDDGSNDGSLMRLGEITDPRLRVLSHVHNRGVGSARNTGVDASRGEWVVFLDSDDELVPGALRLIEKLASRTPDEIGALWFRCRMDDGAICPARLSSPQEWGYAGFVHFWQSTIGEWRDMLYCIRRRCCEALREPADRMDETKYLLDFAKRFRIRSYPDVLRLYHQDADNQLVRFIGGLDPESNREFIQDRVKGFRDLLAEHGTFVAEEAPCLYREYLQLATASAVMADHRSEALRYALELLRLSPSHPRSWILLGASIVGPAAVTLRRRMTRRRAGLKHQYPRLGTPPQPGSPGAN